MDFKCPLELGQLMGMSLANALMGILKGHNTFAGNEMERGSLRRGTVYRESQNQLGWERSLRFKSNV